MAGRAATVAGAWVAAAVLAATASGTASPVPDVTIIGDSVMTGVLWHPAAVSIVQAGLGVRWEVAICRTLSGISCPFDGSRPPTLVDVVHEDGASLGRTVVVEVGYNDPPDAFPGEVDESIDALLAAGVKRILWVDLHEVLPQYGEMNRMLAAAAVRHPEVSIVDWNGFAQSGYGWFQSDQIHLTAAGGIELATLLHAAVWKATAPPLVVSTRPLPRCRMGRQYTARLRASGGRPPYRWQSVSGPLPRGLHLLSDGEIDGVPRGPGRVEVELQVTDSAGNSTRERALITITP
jgi:hypothetical protein